ncbi:hypothetical protein EDC14_104925 [Hydrogenispora ethanolica]|uniref:Uncharacterized protein n=1 Tax=Hydrogenispora ethanolica TaxID=1082276 RepID=A0A4R1QTU6_HYDET|nr:hypothetical protein [Hydrogenispora ethanolica]TCL56501.1 hypothetical protein EDC14_104925 [Hydrogenispora ethanolica]
MNQSKQNQPKNLDLKQAQRTKAQSNMESSAELARTLSKQKQKDGTTEKPKVDPGIDYMKWSD